MRFGIILSYKHIVAKSEKKARIEKRESERKEKGIVGGQRWELGGQLLLWSQK